MEEIGGYTVKENRLNIAHGYEVHSPGRWSEKGRGRGSETGDNRYDATQSRRRPSVVEERTAQVVGMY